MSPFVHATFVHLRLLSIVWLIRHALETTLVCVHLHHVVLKDSRLSSIATYGLGTNELPYSPYCLARPRHKKTGIIPLLAHKNMGCATHNLRWTSETDVLIFEAMPMKRPVAVGALTNDPCTHVYPAPYKIAGKEKGAKVWKKAEGNASSAPLEDYPTGRGE